MRRTAAVTAAAGVAGAVVLGAAAFGVVGGRRAVHPRPKRRPRVLAVDEHRIRLERTHHTEAPGTYRIRFGDDDARHALVGDVVARDDDTVTRTVLGADTGLPGVGDVVLWTGYVFATPDDVGTPFREVQVDAPSGRRAAWLFEPEDPSRRWAVHVHGIHSSRTSALRSVPATVAAGMPSLVVSYRGDAEDPATPPATLGQDEARDVDAAVRYALDHGAEDVVLVGWSMGGTISVILADEQRRGRDVAGVVLVGPALDWRTIIRDAARRSGIPSPLAPLFTAALTVPVLAHAAGLRRPLRARHLRPSLGRVPAPVLILHSTGDAEAPLASSEQVAADHPDRVRLERFGPVPHGTERNAEPERFDDLVTTFLRQLPPHA